MKFITSKAHTVIGLVVGVLLLLAPSLFGFSDNATANTVTMGAGIFIILSELVTTSRMSPIKLIPMRIHLILDYLTGALILFSPWLFGFAEEVTIPHVIVGILVIGYAAMTNPDVESEKSVTQ
jgi:hypothetical protein